MKSKTFYHSGEIGDLLYSLQSIKHIGNGELYIGNNLNLTCQPHETISRPLKPLTWKNYRFLQEFVESQPYINKFIYGIPRTIDYNLNYARRIIHTHIYLNHPETYMQACGLPINPIDNHTPWISVTNKKQLAPITVVRTERRQSPNFPWKLIVEKYKNDMVFIGTKSEYDSFSSENGVISHFNSDRLMDIAEVVNGAKLHIGSSTSLTTIAEGLKKRIIFENQDTKQYHTNVKYQDFHRDERFNVAYDETDIDSTMEKIEEFLAKSV
jgi:hypothetical protein